MRSAEPAAAGEIAFRQQPGAAMAVTDPDPDEGGAGAEPAVPAARTVLCRVDRLGELNHDMRELRLALETGGPFRFLAGQYVQIEFTPELLRHYSIASTPAEEQLVFHLRLTPEGRTGSHIAQQLQPGAKVKVTGPLGSAYLRERHAGPVLLVAGGSGLAPMLSILRTLLARDGGARARLYFGVRGERDVYHERLLAELAAKHANFSYEIVLSQPEGETPRRRGLVHQAVAQDLADASGYTAYLAGPSAMVDSAARLLLERGVAAQDIHADAFRREASRR